jgi:hypothetical protein
MVVLVGQGPSSSRISRSCRARIQAE